MKSRYFLIVISLFSFQAIYAGGGWPQPKGHGFFKLSEWWVIADQHYTDTGEIDPNVTSGIFNTTLYAEYGFTDKITGILNFPFFSRATTNNLISGTTNEIIAPGGALNSIGDTEIGLKYGLGKVGKINIAATITLGLPLGKTEGDLPNLQTGDGEFNQMLSVDAGFSLGNRSYGNVYVGYNNRTEGYSDEYRFGVELGTSFLDRKLWLTTRLNVVESTENGQLASEINSTSVFANNTEYVGIGLEASYNITNKVGISAGMAGAFSGRIIYARPSYSVGVFLKV